MKKCEECNKEFEEFKTNVVCPDELCISGKRLAYGNDDVEEEDKVLIPCFICNANGYILEEPNLCKDCYEREKEDNEWWEFIVKLGKKLND